MGNQLLRSRWGCASYDPTGEDKVVITCALTGVLANRQQCPHIPYTPVEIAEEAQRAWDAGATVAHIHARNDDGTPTFDTDVFARIKEEVRRRCEILLNFSTGTLGDDTGPQQKYIREVKPEIAALNMGTMNYAKYSRKQKRFVFDMVFPNTFEKIGTLLKVMEEAGVKPELECFDAGHTNSIWPLLDKGTLDLPLQFSFIMGVLGGIPPTVDSLMLQARQIPSESSWAVIGIGREQWRWLSAALVLGGHIRVGLEDNFYLPGGLMAESNGALVDKAVQMSRDIGREPANLEETKRILGFNKGSCHANP